MSSIIRGYFLKTEIICNQIKKKLKEKNITQSQFANLMQVSEPTIKRWLKGEGLLLKDLISMLNRLDLQLSDLASLAEGSMSTQFVYSIEHEKAFIQHQGLLAFFDLLIRGKTPTQIAKKFKLTKKSMIFYLSNLDKLKLIEWLPNNKAKILIQGEPNWIPKGPLSQKFRKEVITEFTNIYLNDRKNLKLGVYALSTSTCDKINEKYQEIIEFARISEIRDSQANPSSHLTTLILGHGKNTIPILTEIPNH